jgi:hypothetical protein
LVRRGLAGLAVPGLAIAGTAVPAAALFVNPLAVGPTTLTTVTMPAPTGVTANAGSGFCFAGNQVQVTVSWTGSSIKDADNNYVVGYYDVLRSTGGGAFVSEGGATGSPPATTFTDTYTCAGFLANVSLVYEVQAATATTSGFRSAYSASASVSVFVI